MLVALDEAAVGRWGRAVVDALSAARSRLDELNVFPVPDGDTGTNLLLTAQAGLAALEAGASAVGTSEAGTSAAGTSGPAPAPGGWAALARGAVLGARGNSGAILAQLLGGLADELAGRAEVEGPAFAAALAAAARAAYGAVADPAEGTFLTVARAGAEAARASVADGRGSLAEVVRAAADGARTALQATPGQLPALADAGVVDAGGAGWCLVLDALVGVVTGTVPDRPPLPGRPDRHPGPHARQDPAGPASEVQFLLAGSDPAAVDRMQRRLVALGDSLVVVGVDTPTGREWHVHVHVTDVGAAIEAGIEAGRPHRLQVTALVPARPAAAPPGGRAVVALAGSPGLAALLTGEGVTVLPVGPGDPGQEQVVADQLLEDQVLSAVLGTGAAQVVVLPNGTGAVAVAARAAERARDDGRDVVVVPTRSAVQGMAAVAVADPSRRFGDDTVAMAEAAAATRWAEVSVADQEALTSAGRCAPGDVLGSAEGDVVVIGRDLAAVARDLLDRLLSAGGELVTLVVGGGDLPGRNAGLGDAVAAHLAAVHPTVEVDRHPGGPGALPLLIGVE